MKMKLSKEEYREVEELVNCAVTASTKAMAEPYIRQLEFIANCGGYGGYAFNALHDLVNSVNRAAGRHSDKERLVYFAKMDLCKLPIETDSCDGGVYEN